LLAALPTALKTVFPACKAYVAFLTEAESFEHLHVHVVPREEDMPQSRRGKRVFDWLDMPEEEAVTDEEADRIALELRPLVAQQMIS
jgi:diadenosine tetraphosphate (Ap4A) HIT family hydrolase